MNSNSAEKSNSTRGTLPVGFTPRLRRHYHELLALRRQLLAEHDEQARAAVEPIGESGVDVGEHGLDKAEHELAFSLLATEENALGEVDAALERVYRGVYGFCVATGAPIPEERLRAVPWCRYTAKVQEVREAK